MLIQFRFKNFKSFRDDTILDLSATKITEHSDRVISLGYEKLLPTAAIFGANGSGKSNVIEAFLYMINYVIDSVSYDDNPNDKQTRSRKSKYTPFLFDNTSRNAESSFEVYFMDMEEHGCKSYNYGFTLNQDGVVEEWLNTKAKTARKYTQFFYRNRDELDLSGLPKSSQELIRISLSREALIVSLGAKLKVENLSVIQDWFYNTKFANLGNPFENNPHYFLLPKGFVENKSIQDKVIAYISSFDPSIIGFDVKVTYDEDEDQRHFEIDAIHKMVGGGTASIPLEDESAGTLKMLSLYPVLKYTLENGGVLFVDELNAKLHPLLVRNIIITFLNPAINVKHAQLVFTTNDVWQLSNNLLRRDEIWFIEKDANGISTLYSLADFVDDDGVKIRKDESYEKNYLLGKYGAIPALKGLDVFKEEE